MKKIVLILLLCGGCASQDIQDEYTVGTTLSTASSMVGLHERKNRAELKSIIGIDPVNTEWCAAFVNSILNLNGIPGSEVVSQYPLLAKSFLYWGSYAMTPEFGDIIVFPRGNQGWQGHVGFYVDTVSVDGKLYWQILGGNQKNSVSIELYSPDRALAVRRAPDRVQMVESRNLLEIIRSWFV